MSEPAGITLTRIEKRFGPMAVLRDISLDVRPGEFLTLVGPSGCGKSTLLRIIAGLEAQTEGHIAIAGRPVDALGPDRRDIAMVFQNYALYPHMTVAENMAFSMRLRRAKKSDIEVRVNRAAGTSRWSSRTTPSTRT